MSEIGGLAIALRPVRESDLDALFDQMRDPESVQMAAFTPDDPDDRERFDLHMATVLEPPDVTMRAARLLGSDLCMPVLRATTPRLCGCSRRQGFEPSTPRCRSHLHGGARSRRRS
jgi:hypothetical protein